jgi:hypothetical protein
VQPQAGTVLDFLTVTHKLTSGQTGGAYCLFETAFEPRTGNRPPVRRRHVKV